MIINVIKRNGDFDLHTSFIFLQLFASFTCKLMVKKFFRQNYLLFIFDEVKFIKSWTHFDLTNTEFKFSNCEMEDK